MEKLDQSFPAWLYNEMRQTGTDYDDEEHVKAYDLQMQRLRDPRESEAIIKSIDLKQNDRILEIGTGTGNFAVEAARYCEKVTAIDVSQRMLEFARHKAHAKGIKNIEFVHAGFLTYVHDDEPFDAVVSQLALHHLPDFWKMIALGRISGMLKGGGIFYLRDSVYSFDPGDHVDFFNNSISMIKHIAGEEMAVDFETAVREEYSTLDWIMEGLLEKAGLRIDKKDYFEGFIAVYLCTKIIKI